MDKLWTNDELYIYDLTSGEPLFVFGEVKSIDYGDNGSVHASFLLPKGRGLYNTPDTGATIEIVLAPCGPPDDYKFVTPVIRITRAKAYKWTDVPSIVDVGPAALEMNVLWEGVVRLLEDKCDCCSCTCAPVDRVGST